MGKQWFQNVQMFRNIFPECTVVWNCPMAGVSSLFADSQGLVCCFACFGPLLFSDTWFIGERLQWFFCGMTVTNVLFQPTQWASPPSEPVCSCFIERENSRMWKTDVYFKAEGKVKSILFCCRGREVSGYDDVTVIHGSLRVVMLMDWGVKLFVNRGEERFSDPLQTRWLSSGGKCWSEIINCRSSFFSP